MLCVEGFATGEMRSGKSSSAGKGEQEEAVLGITMHFFSFTVGRLDFRGCVIYRKRFGVAILETRVRRVKMGLGLKYLS
jgi:hypothetical protein